MSTEPAETTESVLRDMLTENTGTHFLDSGGVYGRNWERNQGRDFDKEQEAALRFTTYRGKDGPEVCVEVTLHVYHWLRERLDFNPELDARFREWCDADGGRYGQLPDMEEFVETQCPDAGGIYGEGEPFTVNTYNGEDLLSQTLQYIFWTDEEGEHVLLQIHGGCDVRGGYTSARAFDLDSNHELGLFDNARASLYVDDDTVPEGPAPNPTAPFPGMEDEPLPDRGAIARAVAWYTDDGCHFTGEARETMPDGSHDVPDLGSFDIVEFEQDEHGTQRDEDGRALDDVRGTGVLCIDEDGNGYCPLSGGLIMGAPY